VARSERLLELIQALRRHRRPVSGAVLADELGVSLRTIYRDIHTLIGQGASIDGEAGIGFVLRPGFVLPPLMFTDEELEALVLGSRFLAQRADKPLAEAARNAIAKIAAVLPDDLRDGIDGTGLLAGPGRRPPPDPIDVASIRAAIRTERKLILDYTDPKGKHTGGQCGRLRSVSSIASACSRPGASYARTFAISAPTVSRACEKPASAIPGAGVPS
jgi:predicted DNA-binding transcriptional regulator YafY